MSTSYFPIGLDAVGDNVAASGINLAFYFRTVEGEDVTLTGVTLDSPANQTVGAAIYAVGGDGGGDGLPIWQDASVAVVTGANEIAFDDPVTAVDGVRYLLVIAYPDGGHWGSVTTGGVDLSQPPLRQGNNQYHGAFIDGSDTLPASVTSAGFILTAPWEATTTYYGAGVFADTLPSKIAFTVARVDADHVSLDWVTPGDAPDGVSIGRVAGSQLGNDPDGHPRSDPAYDPTAFSGFVELADGLTDGPYVDTVPDPGGFTYWVWRT